MENNTNPVSEMHADECWDRLGSHQLGRLVTHVGDVVDVFPVNYAVDGRSIVFRTAEGSKLLGLTVNDEVLFEVDDYTVMEAWSVVVRGRAVRLELAEEIAAADELPLAPMVPTLKCNYVRITPETMTGRFFQRGPEPDRYGVQPY